MIFRKKNIVPDALPFAPKSWAEATCRTYANCYAYALGDRNMVLLQMGEGDPGSIVWQKRMGLSRYPREFMDSSEEDGLVCTQNALDIRAGFYPAAFFFCHDLMDYHWMRMNQDGTWSQKFFGQEPSLVYDKEGSPIREPEKVQLGKYCLYRFVSYFNVPVDLSIDPETIRRGLERTAGWMNSASRHFSGLPIEISSKDFYKNKVDAHRRWLKHQAKSGKKVTIPVA